MPANVCTSQTRTYNLNSYDSRTRAWAEVFTQQNPHHNVPRQSLLIFSVFLHQISSRRVQSIFETTSTKSEACPTMPCISLVKVGNLTHYMVGNDPKQNGGFTRPSSRPSKIRWWWGPGFEATSDETAVGKLHFFWPKRCGKVKIAVERWSPALYYTTEWTNMPNLVSGLDSMLAFLCHTGNVNEMIKAVLCWCW